MSKAISEDKQKESLIQADMRHSWHHLMQHAAFKGAAPMIVAEGEGLRIRDINGREYLDATSGGVWCVNLGYGRQSLAQVVYDQLLKMPYYAATAGNIPFAQLSAKMTELMPEMGRVYISNSGSEANEKAYKMVRALGHIKHGGRKKKILYRDRDYHGTTIAALSSTGQPQRREWFGPFVDGFTIFPHALCYRCAYGKNYPGCDLECAKSLEEVIRREGPDEVGAVIVEPITAGGGIIPPVPEYYDVLQGICRQHGVLLIMDEVVCGMGRTGEWFGYEHYGASPDIVTMAKGLASAYMPISMTVTTEEVFKAFVDDSGDPLSYFRDISTYGGCAAACAAALENIRIIEDEDVLANVRARGEQLMQGLMELKDHPHVGDVRGKGLLAGFEMVEDKGSKTPLAEAKVVKLVGDIAARGVLVGRTNRSFAGMNNTINLAPALVATADDIQTIIEAISASLEAM